MVIRGLGELLKPGRVSLSRDKESDACFLSSWAAMVTGDSMTDDVTLMVPEFVLFASIEGSLLAGDDLALTCSEGCSVFMITLFPDLM